MFLFVSGTGTLCKGYLYLDRIAHSKTDCPLYRGKDIDETIYRKQKQLYIWCRYCVDETCMDDDNDDDGGDGGDDDHHVVTDHLTIVHTLQVAE